METDTRIRMKKDNRQKFFKFSRFTEGHKSMEQTIMSNMEIVKQVKKAHARLKKEQPEIYRQFVDGIFS